MENIKKILYELGLSSYKIETYLSLLKIGSGTVQQIAKNSKVPSNKLYENLKWLHEQGFISMILQKPVTYKANNPKTILKLEITKRKENLDILNQEVNKIKNYYPLTEKDIVQITTSREAFFKKIKEEVSLSKSCVSYIVNSWEFDSELWRIFNEKIKKGVKVRALGPILEKDKSKINLLKEAGIKIKDYVPKNTRYSVFDKKRVCIRLKKNDEKAFYTIWISSDVLAEILEDYFEVLWKNI